LTHEPDGGSNARRSKLTSKDNVFSQSKSSFFKSKKTVVKRFWDAKHHTLLYLTYTNGGSGASAAHSLSVVVVPRKK
jgi:catabolite regulation protein CreA